MKNSRLITAVFLAAVMSLAMLAFADLDKPADNMEILRKAIQANKKLVIAENMELTPLEGEKFWPLYDDYQKQLQKLDDQKIALIEKYAKDYLKMTDELALELLDSYMSIEAQRLALQTVFVPRFKEVLPPIKVVRYFQCENKIAAIINFDLAAKIPLIK
ncbi:MAG: hypothetical protein ACYTE5_06110 [Planctomycetota bacterium]|jgi:hypothetical protein